MLVSGGGTGGHISPALAIIAEDQASPTPAEEILWLGTTGEMEETLVPRAGLRLVTIPGGGLHGVNPVRLLRNALSLFRGWLQARKLMHQFQPDVILLTGGYTNAPAALAAWEQRVPMLIFLPDIEPGLAIKSLSRLVTRIACTAEDSREFLPKDKVVVTGYPVRRELLLETNPAMARDSFDLAPDQPTLLVFGGSRGARTINNALLAVLEELLADVQIIHISGPLDWDQVEAATKALPTELASRYRPFPYLHNEMGRALCAADLVVARAGAATLGEFPAFGLPAILVPYPFAWRYQKVNADYMAAAGAAFSLQDELMATMLLPVIRDLMNDPQRLARMAQASRALYRPDAARSLVDQLAELAGRDESGPEKEPATLPPFRRNGQ